MPPTTSSARATVDGTIIAYKNGVELGRTTVAVTGTWTGRIGVRFEGTGTGTTSEARFDNFGGGNMAAASAGYQPTVYEVGPGRAFGTIQSALDQSAQDAAGLNYKGGLVVVYPGQPDLNNLRANPRGAYYENLIVTTPVKLQGVGPGGFRGATFVPGSIIDGGAFCGDVGVTDFSPRRSHLYLVAGFRWQVARFYLPPETCHLPPFQVAKN